VNAHYRGQFKHFLLQLSSFIVYLTIFFLNFLNFMLTVTVQTTYCISCVVCYKVEELRSRYDAKLKNVFLIFSSDVFLQKCKNWA